MTTISRSVENLADSSEHSALLKSRFAQTPGHYAHDTLVVDMRGSMHSVNDDVVVHGQWSEDINTLLLRDLRHLSRHQSVPTAHVQPVTLFDFLGLNGPL